MNFASRILRSAPVLSLALGAVPLLGCPAEDGGDDGADDSSVPATTTSPQTGDGGTAMPGGDTSADTGTPATTTSATTTATTAADDPTAPPVFFDLGVLPDSPPYETACGKVDFLFVVDNSGSMSSSQANLVANWPAFINGIQDSLEGVDSYHVGVVTTDTYSQNIPGCQQLSSLVVQSNAGVCGPYAEGFNFMTEEDDLPTAFTCAASVGTVGSASERPMQAMVEAVTGVEADPGECNEGFMREDALLVITIITDEPDVASLGTEMEWFDDVVAAKGGFAENIVVLSLINTPGGICSGGTATRIANFTTMFGINGFMADICIPDFAPAFQEAIAVIDIACENFMVPD